MILSVNLYLNLGESVYDVPVHGPLAYCGLQGFISVLTNIAEKNNLGHPFCDNLRNGPWMLNYIINRMKVISKHFPKCAALYAWLQERLDLVKQLPPSFIPKYFAIVLFNAYHAVKYQGLDIATKRLVKADGRSSFQLFYDACLMTTYQTYGSISSAGLFQAKYSLELTIEPQPEIPEEWRTPSLAAGLPHFATQFMRCWGRDIFIALPGLFLLPGHFDAARSHLISFGSTLRHGLIPNLLDSGAFPRYNARDAAWFWLSAVVEYTRKSPEGLDFLGVTVGRRFIPLGRYTNGPDYGTDKCSNEPDADTFIPASDPRVYSKSNTIAQLCHEILERHAHGIQFREYNAGSALDHAMHSRGFDINIETLWGSGGFVSGGNSDNCGTWMDKMGDSSKAGTKGVPATPRDGAPVEIAGLQKAVLRWVTEEALVKGSQFWPWKGVLATKDGKEEHVTYKDWNDMLLKSFENQYFIPTGYTYLT